jgi:putative endonuclease
MMERRSHVYMLASRRNGTLYTGSTIDLARRIYEHRTGAMPGFTRDYGVTMLVWYEEYPRINDARIREYAIKRWRRAWKLALIEAFNPARRDLYEELGF